MGVGLIYWPGLDALLDDLGPDLTVLELEPQTMWAKIVEQGRPRYRADPAVVDRLAELPYAKLLHGIGQPVGGSVPDPIEHLAMLRTAADHLDAAWVSEHLSFNRVATAAGVAETGFLLPPRQDTAGVRVAAHNVAGYGQALRRPVAFETGANYLAPRTDELSDGEFWSAVAARADCGILLDLHNLWCNEKNGRLGVLEVIRRLPLDRVWEVHLAGGMPMGGYWLDAHSDRIPDPLVEVAASVMPLLPNLGAILYEVLPEHVDAVGPDGIHDQISTLAALWRLRRPSHAVPARLTGRHGGPTADDWAAVHDWESALYAEIRGLPDDGRYPGLADDPGIGVYRELIADFRRGALARTLHYTMTLLLLSLGSRGTHELLDIYLAGCPAETYRTAEADRFTRFLMGRTELLGTVRYLPEVLDYERALVAATVHGEDSLIAWTADPTAILSALDRGTLPRLLPEVHSEMLISA